MSQRVGYVDADYLRSAAGHLREFKELTYRNMRIETGHSVLDVGCGPGTDTIPLAQLVGRMGQVNGIDYDESMVVEAERVAEEAGVSGWTRHKQGDATALPFASDQFDSCRSERAFQHFPDSGRALSEMKRVTKTGGWIVVLDSDWGACGIDTNEVDVERRLMRYFADERQCNGYVGRELLRLFKEQDLSDVACEVLPVMFTDYQFLREMWELDSVEKQALAAKVITRAELERWREGLSSADAVGEFFAYVCLVLTVGRKSV